MNSFDFDTFVTDGSVDGRKYHNLDSLPFSTTETGYLFEVNSQKMVDDGMNLNLWDGKRTDHSTYNSGGAPNTASRMIMSIDQRHLGKATVNFFDGHSETRSLRSLDYSMVNPTD